MMVKIDTKAMLDDVRGRDATLFNLILETSRQAMALFRIYVTVVVAFVSASTAGLLKDASSLSSWIPIGVALTGAGFCVGCFYCIRTMKTARVTSPGRGAEFWQWTRDPQVSEDQALDEYLNQALAAQNANMAVNEESARNLRRAKRAGLVSAIAGGSVALAGALGMFAAIWAYVAPLL